MSSGKSKGLMLTTAVMLVSAVCIAGAVPKAADYLVDQQLPAGNWGEAGFVGESTIGLCRAYDLTGTPEYKSAAESAGEYILDNAGYDPGTETYIEPTYASEAYALTRLSEISADPANNKWRTAVVDLFEANRIYSGSTQGFIDDLVEDYGSAYTGTAAYDLARFTKAAGYIGDEDLDVWRDNLIQTLADVKAAGDCPVTALGAAVWALAGTGGLDDTTLSGSSSYLDGRKVSELPALLADLQGSDGSFAWYFEAPFDYGFTEPTVMAALGLRAAGGYGIGVSDALSRLEAGMGSNGAAYFRIGDDTSGAAAYYTGECLEVLGLPSAEPGACAADYLVSNQYPAGNWGEAGFAGECALGLARAFEFIGDIRYKNAAQSAGDYILDTAGYNPADGTFGMPTYAAEAYALARLSGISPNPSNNQWRTALVDLFEAIPVYSDSTQDFIDDLIADYGSDYVGTAVYDIARFTAAAGYVGADDLDVWRQNLIDTLAEVGNDADCPVTALGAAVAALELTGDLDNTKLSGSSSFLDGKKLSELPDVLAGLQSPDGSFAWYFAAPYDYGYTEPTVMATWALQTVCAEAKGGDECGYENNISRAVWRLLQGLDSKCSAYFKIGDSSSGAGFYYTGETLEVLQAAVPPPSLFVRGDTNSDGRFDIADIVFTLKYLFQDGTPPSCLDTADSNDDGELNISDAVYPLNYFFRGGAPIPEPFPECGTDPTEDEIGCESYAPCTF